MKTTNIIRIKNATFFAYHGAMKEEQSIGGKFDVDVDMYTDFGPAAENDDLSKTVNYQQVYAEVQNIISGSKFSLIETIATRIADSVLNQHKNIEKIAVRVRKNCVPIGGVIDHTEVEVIKENDA